MHKVQAAVVGAGFIGPVHVEGLRRAGVPVAGILGVDAAESQRAALRQSATYLRQFMPTRAGR